MTLRNWVIKRKYLPHLSLTWILTAFLDSFSDQFGHQYSNLLLLELQVSFRRQTSVGKMLSLRKELSRQSLTTRIQSQTWTWRSIRRLFTLMIHGPILDWSCTDGHVGSIRKKWPNVSGVTWQQISGDFMKLRCYCKVCETTCVKQIHRSVVIALQNGKNQISICRK